MSAVHHLELWVPSIERARAEWGWLLGRLGWAHDKDWDAGVSFRLAETYLVLEESPSGALGGHDRMRPGLNHLALWADTRTQVELIAEAAPRHGWRLMFPATHPYAGGPGHHAAYLENSDGFEVELVGRG